MLTTRTFARPMFVLLAMSLLAGCGSRSVNAEESCRNGHAAGCRLAGIALKKQHEMTRAVPVLQKACDGADFIACAELAELAVNGDGGLAVEASRWQDLEQRACDLGNGRACKLLGLQLKFGTTTAIPRYNMPERTPEPATLARSAALLTRAVTLLQTACDARDASSCEELGDLYKDGLSTPDFERAVALYERSCKLGGPTTCIGIRWAVLGSEGDQLTVEKALSLLESACSKKDWRSCLSLAESLNAGKLKTGTSPVAPIPVDQPRAKRLRDEALRLAELDCRTTDDDACRTLAGEAPLGDKTRWFELGCDRGSVDMCVLVGDMYRLGYKTGQDPGKAKQAYDRAAALARGRCHAGDVGACTRDLLPLVNDHGIPLAAGDLEAFWAACRNTSECDALATLYSSGRVVPQDLEKAQELRRLACLPKEFYSWTDYARSCAASAPPDTAQPHPSGIDPTRVHVENGIKVIRVDHKLACFAIPTGKFCAQDEAHCRTAAVNLRYDPDKCDAADSAACFTSTRVMSGEPELYCFGDMVTCRATWPDWARDPNWSGTSECVVMRYEP